MKRVLITGMSGAGKSTVVAELAARGYRAIDLDSDAWSAWVRVDGDPTGAKAGHDWLWRESKLDRLLAEEASEDLFVSGCAANMGRFLPRFDHVVLLSAPTEILVQRLLSRTNNSYGKRPEEIAQVLENLRLIEPKLRKAADHEVDAELPVEGILAKVLTLL